MRNGKHSSLVMLSGHKMSEGCKSYKYTGERMSTALTLHQERCLTPAG